MCPEGTHSAGMGDGQALQLEQGQPGTAMQQSAHCALAPRPLGPCLAAVVVTNHL